MIVKLELVLSMKNDPENIQDNLLLKERICEHLKTLRIDNGKGFKMQVMDAGVYGSGLSSEWEK